jgi:hypothetical protein
MTTIRAHVPVETPAGLVVALPPDTKPPFWPVFDLAVPCPKCGGSSYIPSPTVPNRKLNCCDGWVLHGRYRVLDVRPIVGPHSQRTDVVRYVQVMSDGVYLMRRSMKKQPNHYRRMGYTINLPAAVPGGVALIVEKVSGQE